MNDQASGLRKMQSSEQIKVIAVSGGKGGVGKTNVSLNTAIALGQLGKRVLVLDADLGLANVDVMLGLRVKRNLSHVLSGECELDDIIVEGPQGINVIPATSGTQSMVDLTPAEHAGLIRAFSDMHTKFDVLIVDTAAGISDMVLSFCRASQDVMLVVCDEPTSITDCYALMRSPKEGQQLFGKLSKVADRFLDVALELVAVIPFDENIRKSVRKQQAIVEAYPTSPASVAIKSLADKLIRWPVPKQPSGHLEFFIEQLLDH